MSAANAPHFNATTHSGTVSLLASGERGRAGFVFHAVERGVGVDDEHAHVDFVGVVGREETEGEN